MRPPLVIAVAVASEAAKAASRPRWTAKRARMRRPWATAPLGDGEGASTVTEPASLRMVTMDYSIGRVAIPLGSRPASTQPMSMAPTGMAIKMKNRLSHGT